MAHQIHPIVPGIEIVNLQLKQCIIVFHIAKELRKICA